MDWFENWFNSKYYHILYKNRDKSEAKFFLNNVVNHLKFETGNILDVACGRGRHAKYLSKLGFNVTGIDLSANSIQFAKKNNSKNLKFFVHDMRTIFKKNHFDLVTNLFTSFGYFENLEDEEKAINSIVDNLKCDGLILIDFLNVKKTINNLVKKEKKRIDNIDFDIERKYDNNYITKTIQITDDCKCFEYYEKVRCLTLIDFNEMLEKANMKIVEIFGDYALKDFNAKKSDRLIIIAKKIK